MDIFMQAAIEEARKGLAEGGVPIGSVLVHDGKIIGRGHNQRQQKGSTVLHGEMDALENAGRLPASLAQPATKGENPKHSGGGYIPNEAVVCTGLQQLCRNPHPLVTSECKCHRRSKGYGLYLKV